MACIWKSNNTSLRKAVRTHTNDLRAFYLYNRELLKKGEISLLMQAKSIQEAYGFSIHKENIYRLLKWSKKLEYERTSSFLVCYVIAHWWGLDPIFMILEGRKIIAEEDRLEREKEREKVIRYYV